VLGPLVRRYGGFDTCEDAVQEALLAAARQWPAEGVPENPRGWLATVAARRRIELLRADTARARREQAAAALEPPDPAPAPGADDTLALLMLCCHPALSRPSQVALTLRAVGGLRTAEIARAFLVPESTIGQRISRAKARIKAEGARFRDPPPEDRPQRLAAVLEVLYLIFNEGYTASEGDALHRVELTAEAIRLTAQLHDEVPRDDPQTGEVAGLLALMLLTDARRPGAAGRGGQARAPRRAGPGALGRRGHRGGHRPARRHARRVPDRPLPGAGRDRRRARRGQAGRGHRLAADPRPVRRALRAGARSGRHPQRDRRHRHGRRARRRRSPGWPPRSPRSPGTTGSTPCGRTCWSRRATATPPAPATAGRPSSP
jgi:DNA-directed RNA polymerase specialized sigma24 family protein